MAGDAGDPLRPKAFAVLKFLAENPGQLITKEQMLDAVWPGTFVSDAVLKDSIRQLREALGDDASAPAYIETAHRRGYRFIAAVAPTSVENVLSPAQPKSSAPAASSDAIGILGREAELTRLREWLELAMRGERQTVFVTGEAGMGKTTLVEAFLAQNTRRTPRGPGTMPGTFRRRRGLPPGPGWNFPSLPGTVRWPCAGNATAACAGLDGSATVSDPCR